jgi:hypothetical protein
MCELSKTPNNEKALAAWVRHLEWPYYPATRNFRISSIGIDFNMTICSFATINMGLANTNSCKVTSLGEW